MKRRVAAIGGVLAALVALSATVSAEEIGITVSPSTLYLESQGSWVTVHTDVAYGLVDTATLMLNGVPIAWTKVDNQGNLVAKFELDAVKDIDIVEPPSAMLTLSGTLIGGADFSGTDEVKVVAPRRKK